MTSVVAAVESNRWRRNAGSSGTLGTETESELLEPGESSESETETERRVELR